MKSRSRLMTGVLLAVAMVASLAFAFVAPLGAQTSPPQFAGMYVDQTPKLVSIGDTFTCDVMVTSGVILGESLLPVLITDAEAYMNFDPAKLEVLGITPGTELSDVLQSTFDNVAGTIDFGAKRGIIAPAGLGAPLPQFLLCTLELRAKALTPGTPLQFIFQGPHRITDATVYGLPVLDPNLVFNGNVIVRAGGASPVPTVSQWGAVGMGAGMAGVLVWGLRRRTTRV